MYGATNLILVYEYLEMDPKPALKAHATCVKYDRKESCWLEFDNNQEKVGRFDNEEYVKGKFLNATNVTIYQWISFMRTNDPNKPIEGMSYNDIRKAVGLKTVSKPEGTGRSWSTTIKKGYEEE